MIFTINNKELVQQSLLVTVYDSDATLFDGKAQSLSSKNYKGSFDVLGLHTNFISIIKDKLTIKDDKGQIKEFNFNLAIMRCFKNEVNIYLGL